MDSTDINGRDKIAAALAKAQGEMSNPKFDASNPHFRNKFASLASVRNAVVPVLSKHGICMTQNLTTTERGIACTTYLTHESGQEMTFGPLVMPAMKQDAQGFGSAATYARRYSLMAVCGVVGDDDDDANAATGKPGVHDPLGRADLVLKDEHQAYAKAFREALGDPSRIAEIHHDCTEEGEEFYRAVWSQLDSKSRSAIKKALKPEEV